MSIPLSHPENQAPCNAVPPPGVPGPTTGTTGRHGQASLPPGDAPAWTPGPAPGSPDPRAWLEQFPAPRRGPIANWFHAAVRSGAQEPQAVLAAVRQTCTRRLHSSPDAPLVLQALDHDPQGARAYAASVGAYEGLPLQERRRVKAERTFHYLKGAMVGQPVTEAQLSYLQALGYQGAPPADRAQASTLIDALKHDRGQS